jgi:plastocyanin domain-containing protein
MTLFNKIKNFGIKKDHQTNRTFNFSKGEVNLSFTLRTDKKGQLKDFKKLLIEATDEVDEEINKK